MAGSGRGLPLHRLRRAVHEELGNLRFRRSFGLALIRLLPPLVGNRLRVAVLQLAGVSIGTGTTIGGQLDIVGSEAVTIGRDCWINGGCHLDVTAPITIGNGVALAQQVMILTNTHQIGNENRRAARLDCRPVTIDDGCWIGARVTVLPGVRIGGGSIIAAGAVVTGDVEPNTLAAGVPARLIRRLGD